MMVFGWLGLAVGSWIHREYDMVSHDIVQRMYRGGRLAVYQVGKVHFHMSAHLLYRCNSYTNLIGVGEYTALSSGMTVVSSCGLFGFESLSGLSLSAAVPFSSFGDCDFFSSFNLRSRPSTLFNNASKTSVLGPRFFGTASSI